MTKKLVTIAAAMLAAVSWSTSAYALTLNDAGVVGAFSGETVENSATTTELIAAQHLLDMAINSSDPNGCNLAGTTTCYRTGSNDYSGTLTGGTQVQNTTNLTTAINAGATYVLAKYDGPNAGYVLFNIADWIAANNPDDIPQTSSTIWTNTQEQGYGLSHYTYFGSSTSVPDGGSTAALLGSVLVGLGMLRRRFGRG